MLRDALPAADRQRLRFLPVRDRYDEPAWVQDVRRGVARMLPTPSEQRVALVGHFKDASSNYLRRFPGWTLLDLPRQGSMDATAIRDAYWAATPGTVSAALAPLAQDMPPSTLRFLHDFATLPAYAALQEEWRVLRDYRASWAQAPYPPVFVTVDAVLRCQNHVLLVRRGQAPGKGLWAAPGGFLEPRDTLWQSCLRELSEETGYSAKEWQRLTSIVTTPGFTDEVIHLYAARGLEKHNQHTDEDEFIDVVKLTPQQVREMVLEGDIFDSKTLSALCVLEMLK